MTITNGNLAEKSSDTSRLLDIRGLKVWYKTYRGNAQVVDGVDMYVNQAEKIGLVGESGCGKTTTMKMILQLLNPSQIVVPEGEILFQGRDIRKMNEKEIMEIRRSYVSMISQAPMAALNPVFSIGKQMEDIVRYSGQFPKAGRKEIREICAQAVNDVMIPDASRILDSFPHQLSGGMRQRICIAMSLVTPRQLLIADEPGTALDVTIQDQIHRLLRDLVEKKGRSLIMITHSLGVARELVDRIYIMYAGNIVETAETKSLFASPLHPYTNGLIQCVPRLSGGGISAGIYGYVPDYVNPGIGCRFCSRCPDAKAICAKEKPKLRQIKPGHRVACFKYEAPSAEKGEQ